MILLAQWYSPADAARQKELEDVREANTASGLFRECVYVDGAAKRWTFGDFLDLAEKSAGGEVCVLANTDILFDRTISVAEDFCGERRVVALTRWESGSSPRMLGHTAGERFFSGSQDVWVFTSGKLPVTEPIRRISMGTCGCENAFLGELVKAGCGVLNPAIDIRTRHVHSVSPSEHGGSVGGYYAYPELTTVNGTGYVLAHHWPPRSDGSVTMEAFQTWQR